MNRSAGRRHGAIQNAERAGSETGAPANQSDKNPRLQRPPCNRMSPSDLERLYDEHAQALFAFLLNFTRNEADTRDVLQEVFIKIGRQEGILDGVREERAFMLRLSHNAAIDLIRRRGTREKNHEQLAVESANAFAPASEPD